MNKISKIKKVLPDIIINLLVVLLLAISVVLSIYARTPYMYEGEYIYTNAYSDGYKQISRLQAEYAPEQNAMVMKLEYIENYPSVDDGSNLYYIGVNNRYEASEKIIVSLDKINEGIKSDPMGSSKDLLLSYLSPSFILSSDGSVMPLYYQYISFGYDGAVLSGNSMFSLSTYTGSSHYLYKDGILTKLTIETIRIVLISLAAVILTLYILLRLRKQKIIFTKVISVTCAVFCIGIFACVDRGLAGSYTCLSDEGISHIAVSDLENGEIFVCTSMADNSGMNLTFKQKGSKYVCTRDENIYIKKTLMGLKFYDTTSSISFDCGSELKLNKIIPLIMFVPLTVAILSVVLIRRKDAIAEELEALPYGCYTVIDIAYINDEMQDMEDYYRDNMLDNEFIMQVDRCILPGEIIETPEYTLEKNAVNLYPAQGKNKLNKINFSELDNHGVNYFMAFRRKKYFLVQQLGGITTVVYKLGVKL